MYAQPRSHNPSAHTSTVKDRAARARALSGGTRGSQDGREAGSQNGKGLRGVWRNGEWRKSRTRHLPRLNTLREVG